jgi:hypothetical protein
MEPIVQKPNRGVSIVGIVLIVFGVGLFLRRLEVLHYRWGVLFWAALAIAGFAAVVQAFISKRRGVVFWGSLLFFVSVSAVLSKLSLFGYAPWDVPAIGSLALGFSFLILFLFDPRQFGVLVPTLLFGGYGVLYFLWWWDILDWYQMKHVLFTYWPVIIILWGLSLLFRRSPRNVQ